MDNLYEIYDTTDANATYNIYDSDGQYGIAETGSSLPSNAVVMASDVSGATIQNDAKNELKDLNTMSSQSRQNAQQEEEQISEQYYSYLTNGSSSSGNLCSA